METDVVTLLVLFVLIFVLIILQYFWILVFHFVI